MLNRKFRTFFVTLVFGLTGLDVSSQLVPPSKQTIEIQKERAQCKARHGEEACSGFPVRDQIAIYKEPNASSQVVKRVPFDSYIGLLDPNESVKYPGWVSISTNLKGELVRSWMRHEDVVLASDLRRVVDCWPVEAINWDEDDVGDYAGGKYRLRFDRTGKIKPSNEVQGRYFGSDLKKFAVYYDRGIFLIAPHTDLNIERFTPFFVLDYANKKLVVTNPVKKPSARFFPQEKLQGCKDIPTVDARAGMKFR